MPKGGAKAEHHRALAYELVGQAVDKVRGGTSAAATKLAFEFMALTATRSGEARGATWDEIDVESAMWTIPKNRMKARVEHRVPLSGRCLEILREARRLGEGPLVFPSARGGGLISAPALVNLLRNLDIPAVPHGFRSSFRDWASERTDAPRAVAEAALAHSNPNAVEAAYARSDLLAKRRELMQRWADYLKWGDQTIEGAAATATARAILEDVAAGRC